MGKARRLAVLPDTRRCKRRFQFQWRTTMSLLTTTTTVALDEMGFNDPDVLAHVASFLVKLSHFFF
jgi:hypothetical protein